MNKQKAKVLLVGWDAADWQIINPLLKQGKLPAMARLLKDGAQGNIVTLDPPISPMLWTSIATGKHPYKHGIHGFTELAHDKKTVRPVRVNSRKCKAVWNILNDFGYKTNVIGWWPSHPAEQINGICVSNFYGVTPKDDSPGWPLPTNTIFPPEMEKTFGDLRLHPKEITAEIMRNFFPQAGELNAADDEILRSCMRIVAHATSIHAAATEAMENSSWDFMAVYYDALDHFCHLGMKYHPPKLAGISNEDFKKYHYIVEAAYRFHDMMLDRLMTLAGEDCQVFLVSDHGFENGAKRLLNLPDEPGAPALEHRAYGVFAACGSQIKSGAIYGASLLDVAPTILQLFNLPAAKDMDGHVLQQLVKTPVLEEIVSYEDGNSGMATADSSGELDASMLDQLAALGYINKPQTAEEAKLVLSENQYYLARSLAHAGQLKEAEKTIFVLCDAFPEVTRYTQFYAMLLLRQGKFKALKIWLETQVESAFEKYMRGMIYLQQNQPVLAEEQFKSLRNNDAVLVQMATAWWQFGDANRALEYVEKALAQDDENIAALNLKCQILCQQELWEEALAVGFNSLKLLYYQPQIHERIGQCFYALELYAEAAQALEVTLRLKADKNSVKQLLTEIYSSHLKNDQRLEELQLNEVKYGIVVSGFPRSGTSMMMQMLKAANVAIFSDNIREADENNPHGYWELEAVKNAAVDQTFLYEAEGKAVKIVMPILRLIKPVIPLKVIWMVRPESDVLASQERMIEKENKSLSFIKFADLQKENALLESWLNTYPQVEYIKINYVETLRNPTKTAQRIKLFLGKELDEKAVASVVINKEKGVF